MHGRKHEINQHHVTTVVTRLPGEVLAGARWQLAYELLAREVAEHNTNTGPFTGSHEARERRKIYSQDM